MPEFSDRAGSSGASRIRHHRYGLPPRPTASAPRIYNSFAAQSLRPAWSPVNASQTPSRALRMTRGQCGSLTLTLCGTFLRCTSPVCPALSGRSSGFPLLAADVRTHRSKCRCLLRKFEPGSPPVSATSETEGTSPISDVPDFQCLVAEGTSRPRALSSAPGSTRGSAPSWACRREASRSRGRGCTGAAARSGPRTSVGPGTRGSRPS